MVSMQKLQKLSLTKQYFTLEGIHSSPKFKIDSDRSVELGDREATAKVLINLANRAFQSQDKSYRWLAAFAFDYSKKHLSEMKPKSDEYFESLTLIFNKTITTAELKRVHDTDWMRIMQKNFIHYGILASGSSYMSGTAAFPIGKESILFDELKSELLGEKILWRKGAEIVFVTDKDHKLKNYYFCGVSGILPGTAKNPEQKNELPPYMKVPGSGSHYVWVNTSFKVPNRVCFFGDHGYLGLEDDQGNVAIYGDYGAVNNANLGCRDAIRHVPVGVEAPDSYVGVPETGYVPKRIKIKITEEQYSLLKESAIHSIQDKEMQGSLLKQNCTKYVVDQLVKVGLHPDTEMSAAHFFARKLLKFIPFGIGRFIVEKISNLPKYVLNFLHFIPIIYIPNFIFGFSLWLGAILTEENVSDSDIKLLDLIFKPWSFSAYHPFELARWQDDMVKQGKAIEA